MQSQTMPPANVANRGIVVRTSKRQMPQDSADARPAMYLQASVDNTTPLSWWGCMTTTPAEANTDIFSAIDGLVAQRLPGRNHYFRSCVEESYGVLENIPCHPCEQREVCVFAPRIAALLRSSTPSFRCDTAVLLLSLNMPNASRGQAVDHVGRMWRSGSY